MGSNYLVARNSSGQFSALTDILHEPTATTEKAWPQKCDLTGLLQTRFKPHAPEQGIDNRELRNALAALSYQGRQLPTVNPQSVGRYFREPIGEWPDGNRASLSEAVNSNLKKLATLDPGDDRTKLHLEITLHWHCLCEAEKRVVLEELAADKSALLGNVKEPVTTSVKNEDSRPAVREWLEHTAMFESTGNLTKLLKACHPDARTKLQSVIDPTHKAEVAEILKDRFKELRNTMPMDHMYDYTGFLWDNKRKCGDLDLEKAKSLKVCIVGGGPSGIVAGDLLNRLGVKVFIKEQHSVTGGRMRTERMENSSGRDSPTPLQPGAMRFHTTRGNVYWSIAEHYKLDHRPFPNPSTVPTIFIMGNKVVQADPGEAAPDPTMQKVTNDVNAALTQHLLAPIKAARDAGDSATFRELCDKVKKEFDGRTFRAGLEHLLKGQGIEWGPAEWETFHATGIGVGGYSGYMGTSFLEEFRFLVDERLDGHRQLLDGADAPLNKLTADKEGLPPGVMSLDEQKAIECNVEITGIKKVDGRYEVSSLNKLTQKSETAAYDDLVFAAGPAEAKRLGLTGHQEGSEALMPEEFGKAMESANIVGATKLAIKIAQDLLTAGATPPGNLQTTAQFQQSYLTPPMPGSKNAVLYASYTLGDNAPKMAGIPPDEQLNNFVKKLRDVASQPTDNDADAATYDGLKALADAVEKSKDKFSYVHWGLEKHFGGAFKMDEPNQLNNTRELWSALLKMTDGAIFINEENTFEGGFASGAVAAAINGTQQFIVKHGGNLPRNSPFDQERL